MNNFFLQISVLNLVLLLRYRIKYVSRYILYIYVVVRKSHSA